MTGENALLTEEYRALGRWKDEIEKKADKQNRRVSEIITDELAQLQDEKEETKEENRKTRWN